MREKLVNIVYGLATRPSKVRGILTPFAMLLFLLIISAIIILVIVSEKAHYNVKILPSVLKLMVSLPLMAAGLFYMLWSNLHFFKAKGSPVPFNPPPKVVCTGPFAHVRNPMYLGMFIFILGLGIRTESLALVFIFLPILIALVIWALKNIEEPELEKRLGAEYVAYKKRTPRLFPDISVKSRN